MMIAKQPMATMMRPCFGLGGGDNIGELLGQKRKIQNEIISSSDHQESVKKRKLNEMVVSYEGFLGGYIGELGKKRKINMYEIVMTSFLGKKRKEVVKMECHSCYLPKENPEKPKGEDAHFICEEAQTIGVADGVGSWAKKGIDAGEYARGLMNEAEEKAAMDYARGGGATVKPIEVLNEAFSQNLGVQGSSTACILTLDIETGVLHTVNVGDSGFMVFRDNKLWIKSETQQRRFNSPYQLGNHTTSNGPESAKEIDFETFPGDIIVLGTDGVFDNMFPDEIEEILREHSTYCKEEGYDLDCKVLADTIAKEAHYNSMDEEYISPFAEEAQKAGVEFTGGKIDDITVIVAHVLAASQ